MKDNKDDHCRVSFLGRVFCLLLVLVFLLITGGCNATKTEENNSRVSLFGIDGATFTVLYPLIKMGYTPTFDYLVDNGAFDLCETILPTLSPVIWTSVITGRTPTDHGIHHFLYLEPGQDEFSSYTSLNRKVPALWEVATKYGKSGFYFNWMMSWPVDEVKGALIGDKLEVQLDNIAWPPGLEKKLKSLLITPTHHAANKVKAKPGSKKGRANPPNEPGRLMPKVGLVKPDPPNTRLDFLLEQVRRYRVDNDPDIFSMYINNIDPVEHISWAGIEPDGFNLSHEKLEKLAWRVPGMYQQVDRVLAEVLALDTRLRSIVLVSDHGMESRSRVPRTVTSRDINVDLLLAKLGLFYQNKNNGKTDWQKTVLNTIHYDAYGCRAHCAFNSLNKDLDYNHDSLAEILFDIRESESGRKLIKSYRKTSETTMEFTLDLYTGGATIFTFKDTQFTLDDICYNNFIPAGFHHNAPPGVFIVTGPVIRKGRIDGGPPSIFDVLPTVAVLAGFPVSEELKGSVQPTLFVESPDYSTVATYGERESPDPRKGLRKTRKSDQSTIEHLKKLGYIE